MSDLRVERSDESVGTIKPEMLISRFENREEAEEDEGFEVMRRSGGRVNRD